MMLRKSLASTILGRARRAFYCLNLCIALPFAYELAQSWGERILLWLSVSAGAILLQRITEAGAVLQPADQGKASASKGNTLGRGSGIKSWDLS